MEPPAPDAGSYCQYEAHELPAPSRCAESTAVQGDVIAETQSDVDALVGCERIEGMLGLFGPEVVSVAALASLTEVGGSVAIGIPTEDGDGLSPLCSLAGLGELTNIGQELWIRHTNLENLDGLASLRQLGTGLILVENPLLSEVFTTPRPLALGSLLLWGNDKLASLDGLEEATGTLEHLAIHQNNSLVDATGLRSISGVSLLMGVEGNASLERLDVLGSAAEVASLVVGYNPALVEAPSLARARFHGTFHVTGNEALRSIALSEQTDRLFWLEVTDNVSLRELEAPGLTTVQERVIITYNPQLPNDPTQAWAETLEIESGRRAKVDGNQGTTPLQDPCPWREDGTCDAPPEGTLCAADTDDTDCHPPD